MAQEERYNNIRSNPLLPNDWGDRKYCIMSPAVNSSGDIYHTLSYLIICKHMGWYVPSVFIGYDAPDTYEQAKRALYLASIIGLDEHVCLLNFKKTQKSYQASPRTSTIRNHLFKKGKIVIDQKMTTLFMASLFQIYGRTYISAILRQKFSSFNFDKIKSEHRHNLYKWVFDTYRQIMADTDDKCIVLLNHRESSAANMGKSLWYQELGEIQSITNTLKSSKFCLLHSKEMCSPNSELLAINIFEVYPKAHEYYIPPILVKIRHILLLNVLAAHINKIIVIGGTSGILDIWAFMGFNVFNLHRWQASSASCVIPYQEYRVFLQSNFMSVVNLYQKGLDEEVIAHLVFWLQNPSVYQCFINPSIKYIQHGGGNTTNNDCIPFIYAVQKNNPGRSGVLIRKSRNNYYGIKFNKRYHRQNSELQTKSGFFKSNSKLLLKYHYLKESEDSRHSLETLPSSFDGLSLEDKRQGKIYCKDDFFVNYGKKRIGARCLLLDKKGQAKIYAADDSAVAYNRTGYQR